MRRGDRAQTVTRPYRMRALPRMPALRRMFKHVYNSLRDAGRGHADAVRVAAATVNRHRAEAGLTVAEAGRRGWWPGKRSSGKRRHA